METSNINPVEVEFNTSGNYTIDSVWDDNCKGALTGTNTFEIEEIVPTVPVIDQSDMILCEEEVTTLTASNIGANTVNGWVRDNVTLLPNTASSSYDFTASTNDVILAIQVQDPDCGTVTSDPVSITVNPLPSVSAGNDVTLDIDATTTINGSAEAGSSIIWSPVTFLTNETTSTPTVSAIGIDVGGTFTYTITASLNGCDNSDEVIVTIVRDLKVFSSFSPNGDDVNDYWLIEGLEAYEKPTVQIYNRWGQELYKSNDYTNNPWDGRFNGTYVAPGTYYYLIESNDADTGTLTGPLTIIR